MSAPVTCGTRSGWNHHIRTNEPVCAACNRANTLYQRDLRSRKGQTPVNFPRVTRAELRDAYGLGARLAESFRATS